VFDKGPGAVLMFGQCRGISCHRVPWKESETLDSLSLTCVLACRAILRAVCNLDIGCWADRLGQTDLSI